MTKLRWKDVMKLGEYVPVVNIELAMSRNPNTATELLDMLGLEAASPPLKKAKVGDILRPSGGYKSRYVLQEKGISMVVNTEGVIETRPKLCPSDSTKDFDLFDGVDWVPCDLPLQALPSNSAGQEGAQ